MTKILAKTKGYVLNTGNIGEFLDGTNYHVVEYDGLVRNWENRGLIAEKYILEGNPTDEEFKKLGKDEFLKKYKANKTHEEKKKEALEKKEEKKEDKKVEVNVTVSLNENGENPVEKPKVEETEEVKTEEVKTEEVKNEEVKTPEVKNEKNKNKTSEKKDVEVVD